MFGPMKLRAFTSRLLVVLALFGLVLAPLTASSAVLAMTAQTMGSMPDGMPCPDGQPAIPDCAKDCPLAVLCASGLISVPVSETPTFLVQLPIGGEFIAGREAVLSSLVGEPAPRPPKA